ncbi:phosphatidylserine decarboxylase [Anaerobacillus sp. MEB173]|uniref:phosphatidylserine decarboxylase n=1 Tax=Anaerobacillus sp. MEB173 TaxID=3383345 RepID=UPI003F8F1A7D
MRKVIYRSFVELSGNRINSYLLKKFTSSRISRHLNKSFVKVYKINQQEMEKPIEHYKSLHDLFCRRLKSGSRKIDNEPTNIVSPVDGVLAERGKITDACQFYVKGQHYSLHEMLGDKNKAERYRDGNYMVLYLSPSHYHRIHSPVNGTVLKQWQLGRKSFPVNKTGLKYGKRPLSRNYRLITELQFHDKCLAIVKVGAMNVNSIHSTFTGDNLHIGQEMAYFSFGSTVVLLFEKGTIAFDEAVPVPSEVKVGMKIGCYQL